ncbi:hypothetical protein MGG_08925 [Pyricularia oryzae 70-15]|uniref:Bromodomain-containing factor 1 n=3 Tax=Pyricularia oryzae TaxID=318829 RepID=G4MVP0_PYRO7|nr:uncharacterized protein MGG_08925 [Pyricularia oryzae 70-15]EHA54149.1 hypothetical protein MGG_08925 [Pyricularia oryzae 70-15]KAI7930939.1 hypothetical protein M9X92_000619 [Pyricularia oryzae]KAI7932469.1 hypothetical protein M0657_000599 [Pyricularia oryzae]
MAVMASPKPDATAVDQKQAVKMASIGGEDSVATSNGVEGHSPTQNGVKSSPEATIKGSTDPATEADADIDKLSSNHAQNSDAFSSNKLITTEPTITTTDETEMKAEEQDDKSKSEAEDSKVPAANGTSAKSGDDDVKDESKSAKEEDEVKPAAQSATNENPKPDESIEDAEESKDAEMSEAPPSALDAKTEASGAASPKSDTKPASPKATKESEESSATKTNEVNGAEDKVDSESKPTSTDSSLNPPSMSNLAIDASQDASVAENQDTSMAEAPSQTNKVAREREDDTSEEPAAKRAKTESRSTELDAETTTTKKVSDTKPKTDSPKSSAVATDDKSETEAAEVDAAPFAPEPMDVDPEGWEESAQKLVPKPIRALPGSIMHPTSYDKPISEFANREIRRALGSVKKTKAGGNFKDSVAKLWPVLAESYNSKVKKPMDIGLMERNLRTGVYKTIGEFKADLDLLVLNSYYFNGAMHDVTKSAISLLESVLYKLVDTPLDELNKPSSSQSKSASSTRHAEPRAATQPKPKPAPAPAKPPPPPAPIEKVVQSPIHAAPAARRDSKDDDRPKRPIHPPKKELGYDGKGSKKKKLSPDLKYCDDILKDLAKPKSHGIAWIFAKPVDETRDGAPGYYSIIKKPMDLGTMTVKLQEGKYRSAADFKADFDLMLNNCFTFNPAGTDVHALARNLEAYFQDKWAGIDAYVAKHASRAPARRTSASSPSAGIKDESEDEGPASEPEPEVPAAHLDQIRELKKKIDAVDASITKHKEQYTEEVANSADPSDTSKLDILMSIIQMLNKDLGDKKKKLAELEASTPASKPKPAAKAKKAAAAGNALPNKKAAGGNKKASGAGGKKSSKRVMSTIEKEAIANGINELDGTYLEQAVAVIKKDTNQEENGDGELELEIEQLSIDALNKLYDLMCSGIKGFRSNVESMVRSAQATAPPPAQAPPAIAGRGQKPKKNKPMGKGEQERKLEHLEKLKAQYTANKGRQGSGSQEPPGANELASQEPADEEDSDVSSEEE